MKLAIVLLVCGLGLSGMNAQAATPGTAAELGLHKIERLVTLKKINPSFLTQTIGLSVESTGGGFNIMVMQGADADEKRRMVAMTANKDGKILTYVEATAGEPASPISLPVKNSISLYELAMHCTAGELIGTSRVCADSATAKMYGERFKTANLAVIEDTAGKVTGAQVSIQGDGLAKTLAIVLANDGSLVSLTEK